MMRYLCVLIMVCVFAPPLAFGFHQAGLLDNFNRADEDPLAGIWSNGVTGTGNCRIVSNILEDGSGDKSCWVTSTYPATQEAYVTLPNATNHNTNTNVRLLVCLQDGIGTGTVDGYAVRFQKKTPETDRVSVQRLDNGGFTTLGADMTLEISNGDRLGIVRSGNDIELWTDTGTGWQQQMVRTDSTYTCASTNIGIIFGSATHNADDFGGGDASASTSGPFSIIQFR